MSEHFTQMRRTVTQSKASSPKEWYPKSEDHLKRMTAAKELTISAIIGHASDKVMMTFWGVLKYNHAYPKVLMINLVLGKAFAFTNKACKDWDFSWVDILFKQLHHTETRRNFDGKDASFNSKGFPDDDRKTIIPKPIADGVTCS